MEQLNEPLLKMGKPQEAWYNIDNDDDDNNNKK